MGEAKRRKQLLGDTYGSPVKLEKCAMPAEISLGYVSDEALSSTIAKWHSMPNDFKSTFFTSLLKAKGTEQPGIVFAESLRFSGGVGVQITFRDDIETFVKSRCNKSYQASQLIQKIRSINYNSNRVIALLAGSDIPILLINVYSLHQIETLLNCFDENMPIEL